MLVLHFSYQQCSEPASPDVMRMLIGIVFGKRMIRNFPMKREKKGCELQKHDRMTPQTKRYARRRRPAELSIITIAAPRTSLPMMMMMRSLSVFRYEITIGCESRKKDENETGPFLAGRIGLAEKYETRGRMERHVE
uniref:Uncharacterized protein n=1 Tax=Caenorhabditis tropicalis TaxID=1561998 RepID=A0A1I7T4C2_9PELO